MNSETPGYHVRSMSKRGRHAPRRARGSTRVTIPIVLGLLLLAGGGVFAAYRYDASTVNRVLPGVTVAGVDVGGMTRSEAIAAVKPVVEADLSRRFTVRAGGETWPVSPADLGTRTDFRDLIDQAIAINAEYAWPERTFHRLLDRPIDQSLEISYSYNEERVERFVETVAGQVAISPTNAAVDFENGELVLRRPEEGRELRIRHAEESLMAALETRDPMVRFDTRTLAPAVTREDLGYTIVIRLSELQLYLYDGLQLVKTYPVAAGQPAYPTPMGDWTIVNKAENPTWVNPAPDGWGADMPATIEGGPGNPLGTRALYLDAPGIRIHGTYDSGSIGTYASHGCIRMLISDVEELYGTVPIGTPVHIVS
jgi:lipoprotein-anchoring transpeptidase ErfK/SrfK